jgi:hypothetical protein
VGLSSPASSDGGPFLHALRRVVQVGAVRRLELGDVDPLPSPSIWQRRRAGGSVTRRLLTHFIYEFYPSDVLGKSTKI